MVNCSAAIAIFSLINPSYFSSDVSHLGNPKAADLERLQLAECRLVAAMATCHKDGFATISQYTASIARKAG